MMDERTFEELRTIWLNMDRLDPKCESEFSSQIQRLGATLLGTQVMQK